VRISAGPQLLGDIDEGSRREWLVTDGLGGFAMGTANGLATRRYHGLLVVATDPPRGRHMGLFSLDPTLVVGDRRIELATHEWAGGAVAPNGHRWLAEFEVDRGVPRWRWQVGDVVVEAELAMADGRPAVGVVHRLLRAPGPVRLEVEALCTWRDVHGERHAYGEPAVEKLADGFVFEGAYRVRGPAFAPKGAWYHGLHHREEAARGLQPAEDVFAVGSFSAELTPESTLEVDAWAGEPETPPPAASQLVLATRRRYGEVAARAGASDAVERTLAWAAQQFVVAGPTVVAGYPWFGDWSRDTMTSYVGLFIETNRLDEGRQLLENAAAGVSRGMLANTADVGGTEYNTVDAAPWFLHAVSRHVAASGDLDLAAKLFPTLESIIDHHVAGTRFGIRVDDDGLVTQGEEGWALTWMDARIDGRPVTPRWGKPVEVNALWVSGLAALSRFGRRLGRTTDMMDRLETTARRSFLTRFAAEQGLYDVIDGPDGDDATVRPNQLLAVALPDGPSADPRVVAACAGLLTPLGLRSLAPGDPRYLPHHRGDPAARDAAYHQGTVWPWMIGPYVDAGLRTGVDAAGLLGGLEAHLAEWGLGSVSETADADTPHTATGCPFQAWSVAELLRARRRLQRATPAS
jgi:predicted glycogen debranching enzyme